MTFLPEVEIPVVDTGEDFLIHRIIAQPQKTIHVIHPPVRLCDKLFILDYKYILEILSIRLENLMADQPVLKNTCESSPVEPVLAIPSVGGVGNRQGMPKHNNKIRVREHRLQETRTDDIGR